MNLKKFPRIGAIVLLLSFSLSPVLAHHATGGETPNTLQTGFLSGLAHPVIGLDHLAAIIAVGILGALRGIFIPIGFVLATSGGAGLHLLGVEIPLLELIIAISVLVFGLFVSLKSEARLLLVVLVTWGAGLFHGYAYGEAIFGAKTTALVSYLIGFSLIQGAIAIGTYFVAKNLSNDRCKTIGLVIFGIGITFIFNQLIDTLLPGA